MSNTTDFQQAVASEQRKLATREIKHTREQALMGDVTGVLTGPSGVPWILARLGGDPSRRVEAYNGTSLVPTFNMSVTLLVRYEDGRATHYEVERLSNDIAYADYVPSDTGGYAPHRWAHEYRPDGTGGWDAIISYPRSRADLRLSAYSPPTLHLYVFPGWYRIGSTLYYFTGGDVGPFTPPGSGINFAAVFIDAAGTFTIVPNALIAGSPLTVVIPANLAPVGMTQLTFGQTGIVEADLSQDLRYIVEDSGSGGGGGGSTTEIATDRWSASAAQTDFSLPDTASSLITVSVNGLISDPLAYSLSADGNALIFASGLSASDIVVASYVVETI